MVAVIDLYFEISVRLFVDYNASEGDKFFFHDLVKRIVYPDTWRFPNP